MTLKEIIIESLARSNLVPRKRACPADLFEDAKHLLKGIIQKYNFSNYISYARKEIEVIPTETVVGLDAEDINSIATVQYKLNDDVWEPLHFISYEQFYTENDTFAYTWKYTDEGTIEVYFKPSFISSNRHVKIIYNSNREFDTDKEIHIPEIYEELFTTALTYKLAVTKPRLDATQVAIIKDDLSDCESKVKALVSSNKIITRDVANISNQSAFMSGSFIFR